MQIRRSDAPFYHLTVLVRREDSSFGECLLHNFSFETVILNYNALFVSAHSQEPQKVPILIQVEGVVSSATYVAGTATMASVSEPDWTPSLLSSGISDLDLPTEATAPQTETTPYPVILQTKTQEPDVLPYFAVASLNVTVMENAGPQQLVKVEVIKLIILKYE